jgi:hypothetical protein
LGDDVHVLAKCTVFGCRDYPGLPPAELQALKQYIFSRFPVYWSNTSEFEMLWSDCIASIGQACGRERRNRATALALQVAEP